MKAGAALLPNFLWNAAQVSSSSFLKLKYTYSSLNKVWVSFAVYEHLKTVHGLIVCLRERAFSNGECPKEMQAYSFLVHF